MASLSREYRRQLERVIIEARQVGEKGAKNALKALAVEHHEPLAGSSKVQRDLRNRLRAHGRQLGDRLDPKRGTQTIAHLASECAYEHWHRMLFARFLAENNLLIEPESGVALSLDDCRELAHEKSTDWLELASSFAIRMLPQIFRLGDPVLEVSLPPETRMKLEELLGSLPTEVFASDDSLGWVYQFWQSELKDSVNASGEKIGADELPAVTQLFTEDYMVLFLLHNTLGAWWAAKRKTEGLSPDLPGYEWTYLRLKDDGSPAAGLFDDWPRAACDLKMLDPSMGSGHFLVFALPILVAFRIEEEGLSLEDAVKAVLRDNLFGLELDNRCTQIAAFNLALAAWRMVGSVTELPQLNLACSGLGINAKEENWVKLAGEDGKVRETMRALYRLFEQAPVLGSLVDPKRAAGPLFAAEFEQVRPVLAQALSSEHDDDYASELAVAAQGIVRAAHILADQFTLVATNVPYLGRNKQDDLLREYVDRFHAAAKGDLATCFVERCSTFCAPGGTTALVTPQTWLFLGTYKQLRQRLLTKSSWNFVARLGPRAFETISGEVVNVILIALTGKSPEADHQFVGVDLAAEKTASDKSAALKVRPLTLLLQKAVLSNPDSAVALEEIDSKNLLGKYATCYQGISPGDSGRLVRCFWETQPSKEWRAFQMPPGVTSFCAGREHVIDWAALENGFESAALRGRDAWNKSGILIGQMTDLPATLYSGDLFSTSTPVIIPADKADLPAIWAFCSSGRFTLELRKINPNLVVANGYVSKIPFDLQYWRKVGSEDYPSGLQPLELTDCTQWLFTGHPSSSTQALQVSVARLVGYQWPRQTGSSFLDCPALGPDGLEMHAADDGIVCLASIQGVAAAADRLRALLADAYATDWSAAKLAELLSQIGYTGKTLEDWLRDGFFEQHCDLCHQRPFVWHIWDGLRDGFHALVNYHKLSAPKGVGRQTLEKLIYTYLGDWIDRQRADQKNGVEGADSRVAAAVHLQSELKKIVTGEPPYDIFIRWKPLHEQPIGWEPDINDGVRLNIRPFMMAKALNGRSKGAPILRVLPKGVKWDKDRGKEQHRAKDDFPWFWSWDESTEDFAGGREFDANRWNDLHYSIQAKKEARSKSKVQSRKGAGK